VSPDGLSLARAHEPRRAVTHGPVGSQFATPVSFSAPAPGQGHRALVQSDGMSGRQLGRDAGASSLRAPLVPAPRGASSASGYGAAMAGPSPMDTDGQSRGFGPIEGVASLGVMNSPPVPRRSSSFSFFPLGNSEPISAVNEEPVRARSRTQSRWDQEPSQLLVPSATLHAGSGADEVANLQQ